MTRHLIHIGYPKAGSTFLQAWFERHPELRYAPGGLGGFRDVYEMARPPGRSYKYHVTSFEGLSSPDDTAGGARPEANAHWVRDTDRMKGDQAWVCALLKSLFPGSRILIVTRGFKGTIFSGYSQYVKAGGVLRMSKTLPESVLANAFRQVQNNLDFDYLLRLYGEAFGEDNLIVLPYELLREDEGRFVAVLERHLGLTHAEIRLGRVNPSLSPEELYWYPLISRAVSAAASRLGPARQRKLYGWYVGKTLDNRLRPLVKVLSRLKPGGRITEADFPAEFLDYCQGKATLLRGRPLYAPYAAEYLWGEGGSGS
jgi:hypothetical protein